MKQICLTLFIFLALMGLTACMMAEPESAAPMPNVAVPVEPQQPSLAENPELMTAQRYENGFFASAPVLVPQTPLIDTSESRAAHRYHYEAVSQNSESTFLAANPELMAANRYLMPLAPQPSLAENPELMAAHRYEAIAQGSESTFLAANPELMAANRYLMPLTPQPSLAENPELMAAQRYESGFFASAPILVQTPLIDTSESRAAHRYHYEAVSQNSESTFLAANPELMAANRYLMPLAPQPILADNPELMAAHRYEAIARGSESTYLAANPELMVAGRYAAALEK